MDESYNPHQVNNQRRAPHIERAATTFFAIPEAVVDPAGYADISATNHVTAELENLNLSTDYNENERLMVGNGKHLKITHTSSTTLPSDS